MPFRNYKKNKPTPAPTYGLDLARGLLLGQKSIVIRGHNPTQTSASGFLDVWEGGGDLVYLAAAEIIDIVSDDAADAAAGTGLRTVLVEGVDGTGAAISETVILNGITDVPTLNSYLRVNSLTGLTVGSVGWNVGTVTATADVAATVQAQMNPVQAISQNSQYTVPLGKTLFVVQGELNVAREAGGQLPVVDFAFVSRSGGPGAAWLQQFDKKVDADIANQLDVVPPFPAGLIALTDLKVRANTNLDATEVRTRVYGILIDD